VMAKLGKKGQASRFQGKVLPKFGVLKREKESKGRGGKKNTTLHPVSEAGGKRVGVGIWVKGKAVHLSRSKGERVGEEEPRKTNTGEGARILSRKKKLEKSERNKVR